ncbi:flagellar hook-basal body protein [Paenibacillus dakarensis]|uniref:flagellar hook-basal body protein n=1 Tax=Paenibacillus dakarensis TaxID=1527293 RepID=UPI0006D5B6E5|nr:flagellar hook-basal body protein [Paenibacillus dakarensis]
MNNSMISAMVSMNAFQQRLDVIADNLANVDTVGYKSKDTSFEDVLTQVQGHHKDFTLAGRATPPGYTVGFGSRLAAVIQNMEQGPHKETGNPLDLAIDGNAMFAVQGNGGIAYTREGGFHVSPDPQDGSFVNLVNNQGYQVLDRNNNPIRIPANAKVAVDPAGQVLVETPAGRSVAGVLKLAELQRPEGLVQMAGNLYMLAAGLTEAQVFEQAQANRGPLKSEVQSGFLEQSNVNFSDEMMKMMEVQRAYQLAARALSSSDTMMNLANTMRG